MQEEKNNIDILKKLESQYSDAERYLDKTRNNPELSWDDKEKIVSGLLTGKKTNNKSQVNSNSLLNLIIDQSARVVAQMFTGKINAVTDSDKGKSQLMQIVLEKYIIPKANTQWDMLTKLRLVDMYSLVYGSMPALVTYVVKPNYIGPDLEILHPRNVRVQANKVSIEDADYAFVNTIVNKEFLKGILSRKETVYDKEAVQELLDKVDEGTDKDWEDKSYEDQRQNADNRYEGIELTTKYERNRWIVYSRKYKVIIRDSENPNKDGELPIVYKYTQPLLDRLYGLSIFDRGISVARALDSLTNLYMDSVLTSIRPPVIYNKSGVVPSTIKWTPGAFWQETIPNSIRQMNISPIGTNTYQTTSQVLKSYLMNMGAATDTTVSRGDDIEAGKTPEALRRQAERQGARDNWDRGNMEQFVEKVFSKMISIMAQKQVKPIDIELFESDIQRIRQTYPDANIKVFESNNGVLTITPEELQDEDEQIKYKFTIDSGSSLRRDESVQNETLKEIIGAYAGNPAVEQALAQEGIKLNMGEVYKRFIMTSGVDDVEKLFEQIQEQETPEYEAQEGEMLPPQPEVEEMTPVPGDMENQLEEINS